MLCCDLKEAQSDRHSYHTYCLRPRLHEVPAGEWKCPDCIANDLDDDDDDDDDDADEIDARDRLENWEDEYETTTPVRNRHTTRRRASSGSRRLHGLDDLDDVAAVHRPRPAPLGPLARPKRPRQEQSAVAQLRGTLRASIRERVQASRAHQHSASYADIQNRFRLETRQQPSTAQSSARSSVPLPAVPLQSFKPMSLVCEKCQIRARATGNLDHSHGCMACQNMRAIAEDHHSAATGNSTAPALPRQQLAAVQVPANFKPHQFDFEKELASVGTVIHVDDMITKRPTIPMMSAQAPPKIKLSEHTASVPPSSKSAADPSLQRDQPKMSSDNVNKVARIETDVQ